MDSIIVSGESKPIGCKVRTWHETGLGFPGLGTRSETRAVGLHWTGGYGGPKQVHQTLKDRWLSVQFCIASDGEVWQFADASARASHIGVGNGWCCGIEICNPAAEGALGREQYLDQVHGKTFKASYFTPAQVESARLLCSVLCNAYGLPYTAPKETTTLEPEALSVVRGVVGHFHLSRRKTDPGTRIFRDLGLVK